MYVEFEVCEWEDWRLGLAMYVAEDEHGMHRAFEIASV